MFNFISNQIKLDMESLEKGDKQGVSLLAKWLKSENASSKETKILGEKTRKYLDMSHKQYRKMLSALRTRINIVEKLMSENRWNEIEFDKIPSKAGLIYRNAFAQKDIIADKYAEFISSKSTKVNTSSLYPYEIVRNVTKKMSYWSGVEMSETEREVLNKYWENQKDYLDGKRCKNLCVVDTSGSMTSSYGSVAPIDVAISLGMYCAERIGEPFKNHFISFSSRPQLIEVEGIDFVDKVHRIYKQNLCENTNIKAVFDLIKDIAIRGELNENDLPDTITIISDMEIDGGSHWRNKSQVKTEMERIREEWRAVGLTMPKLVYWNCDARQNLILDDPDNDKISYVSGCSPVIFTSILTGKSGKELMLDILNGNRYKNVQ